MIRKIPETKGGLDYMVKRIKFFLFGSPDRVIASVSLVIGIIGTILSALTLVAPETPPLYIITRDIIILAGLIGTLIAFAIKYFKKDSMVEDFRETFTQQSEYHHHMIHNFRDHYFWDIRNELLINPNMTLPQLDMMQKTYFDNVCRTILTDTRDIFLKYYRSRGFRLNQDLSLTVKIVVPAESAQEILNAIKGDKAEILSNKIQHLLTGYRDPHTYGSKPERSEVRATVYQVNEENTTFDSIANRGNNFYFSNNLKLEYENNRYKNQNPNWQKHYNSVLAVPIRYKRHSDSRANLIYGFLSIDSMNSHGYDLFDDKHTFNLLAASADLLAIMFGNFDMLQLTLGANKG